MRLVGSAGRDQLSGERQNNWGSGLGGGTVVMLDSRKRRSFSALATVVLISLCVTIAQSTASSAAKSKSWLDSNPAPNWNQPGQALPRPIVEDDSNLWRCGEQIR